jgi:hypothetical protein
MPKASPIRIRRTKKIIVAEERAFLRPVVAQQEQMQIGATAIAAAPTGTLENLRD